jgi:hypothetical protein
LRNHLAVRDVLRANEVLRDEYAAAKKQAGARAAGIDEYGQAKGGTVQKIPGRRRADRCRTRVHRHQPGAPPTRSCPLAPSQGVHAELRAGLHHPPLWPARTASPTWTGARNRRSGNGIGSTHDVLPCRSIG